MNKSDKKEFIKIRMIYINRRFYFSVQDFFGLMVNKGLLKKEGEERWNFYREIYKNIFRAYIKGEHSNSTPFDFIKLSLNDVFLSVYSVDRFYNTILPKAIAKSDLASILYQVIDYPKQFHQEDFPFTFYGAEYFCFLDLEDTISSFNRYENIEEG